MYLDLFTHSGKPHDIESFEADVKYQAQQFLDSHVSLPSLSDRHEWYFDPDTQDSLIEWFNSVWAQLIEQAPNAMPAHDKRHALLKVPAAAIECIVAERLYGAERLGVIGALLHDTGRWAEEFLYGHPTQSVFHARLSFLLSKNHFLKRSPLPKDLQDELLHSILTHTTGTDSNGDVLSKVVVCADRAQLVGPEFILRNVHHLAMPPFPECLMQEEGKISLSDRVLRLAGPLPEPYPWLKSINEANSVISIAFVAILEGDNFDKTLAPVEHRFNPEWVVAAKEIARVEKTKLYKSQSVQAWLGTILSTPHIAGNPLFKDLVKSKLSKLDTNQSKRAAKAMAYLARAISAEDARLAKSLKTATLLFTSQEDYFLAHVTRTLAKELF